MNADALLARLDGVRRSGNGWIARCPAHEDHEPSLSLSEGDDGRLLIHCFSGCATHDVLAAIGLSAGDLFPERLRHRTTKAENTELRERGRAADWRAALGVLAVEATFIEVAASAMVRGERFATDDVARLHVAAQRIRDAAEKLT